MALASTLSSMFISLSRDVMSAWLTILLKISSVARRRSCRISAGMLSERIFSFRKSCSLLPSDALCLRAILFTGLFIVDDQQGYVIELLGTAGKIIDAGDDRIAGFIGVTDVHGLDQCD